jgi:hypothetical protein
MCMKDPLKKLQHLKKGVHMVTSCFTPEREREGRKIKIK